MSRHNLGNYISDKRKELGLTQQKMAEQLNVSFQAVSKWENGYAVTAFDAADSGLEKARKLAKLHGVQVDFFRADINEYEIAENFDIIFSSGVFHYLVPAKRKKFIDNIKEHTSKNGIHTINVFVHKPFIETAPDSEETERETPPWYSGELFQYYHDWMFQKSEEVIFDCNSGGIPHQHCMDILVAEKMG